MKYVLPSQIKYMCEDDQDRLFQSFVSGGKTITYFLTSSHSGKVTNGISIDGYTIFTECKTKDVAKKAIADFILNLRLAYPTPLKANSGKNPDIKSKNTK